MSQQRPSQEVEAFNVENPTEGAASPRRNNAATSLPVIVVVVAVVGVLAIGGAASAASPSSFSFFAATTTTSVTTTTTTTSTTITTTTTSTTSSTSSTTSTSTTTSYLEPQGSADSIKVISYNLYWWNAFRDNPEKGERITEYIKDTLSPDTLGAQECNIPEFIYNETGYLPASPYLYNETWPDNQGIFLKFAVFEVQERGYENLQTWGKWGARYVTYVKALHRLSGTTFWHFNSHWCVATGWNASGILNTCDWSKRYLGAQNMLKIIQEKAAGMPAIITGDLNALPGEQGPSLFLENGFSLAVNKYVDYVYYTTQHWIVKSSGNGNQQGSDHWPIFAELQFRNSIAST